MDVTGDPQFGDRLSRADVWINRTIEWTLVIMGAILIVDTLNKGN